jgi:hypothetical protein
MTVERRPRALTTGVLPFGADCYVLDNKQRILSKKGAVRALTNREGGGGTETGNIERYIARLPKRFHGLASRPTVEFVLNTGGVAHGIDAAHYVQILDAYADAFAAGELKASQEHLGRAAVSMLRILAKTGLEALIDEVTGYQWVREHDYHAKRLLLFLQEEMSSWEAQFTASVAVELCRLFGHPWSGRGSHPQWLRGVYAQIYNVVLGDDIAAEMRRRNPHPRFGRNHHQQLQPAARRMLKTWTS